MKRSEAALLLAKIAAYDRRTVGDSDIEAWAEALDGQVTLQDAMTAIRDHFRETTDWLMPADVIRRAKMLRILRIRAAGVPELPPDLTQQQEREWIRRYHANLARHDPPDALQAQFTTDRDMYITRRIESVPASPDRVKQILADFAASLPKVPELKS